MKAWSWTGKSGPACPTTRAGKKELGRKILTVDGKQRQKSRPKRRKSHVVPPQKKITKPEKDQPSDRGRKKRQQHLTKRSKIGVG